MKQKIKIAALMVFGFALGASVAIYLEAQAGSLTPPGSPASTMNSLSDIAGSGFVPSTDSLHQTSLALSAANSSLSAISNSISGISNSVTADSGMTANNGMYNNTIVAMNPLAAYTEVCFKNGSTYYDIHGANVATGGGNCSVGNVGFIIEANERATQPWTQARQICLQNGMRLPEPLEWQLSCNNAGTWGISAMGTNWEWASNSSFPLLYPGSGSGVDVTVFGAGGCGYAGWAWLGSYAGSATSANFRCVR